MATLMIQGTCSDAGKTLVVAGLCRLFKQRGLSVAPFKPQNMANNSAVTVDGGEIGRAQAVQALAAGLSPHTDMNPILLKPTTDVGAQVIINGHVIGNMDARQYHAFKPKVLESVIASYERLKKTYDVILVEGAGSPAEINLREHDIANMGFAEAIDCPVILVGDIDRGGVFAQLQGTLNLLSPSEQARIQGFVINRFRGDVDLLTPGIKWLEQNTGKAVLGVLPYLQDFHLEAEDSLNQLQNTLKETSSTINVIVPALPRISNHTDLDPLRLHPQINLHIVQQGQTHPPADLIILPGSKSVMQDLQWLKDQGWDKTIQRHLRYGGKLIGICGGFQMLGESIHDPNALESHIVQTQGLGLLEMQTTLETKKQLRNREGTLALDNATVSGYEIHLGISRGTALQKPAILSDSGNDGAVSADGQIFGTYWHGLFEENESLDTLLNWVSTEPRQEFNYHDYRQQQIERLASAIEQNLNIKQIMQMLNL